jgi:CubicO group peptidase (beta-lactamase class C family)/poly(3-hydroxybutyrate) depolymerase
MFAFGTLTLLSSLLVAGQIQSIDVDGVAREYTLFLPKGMHTATESSRGTSSKPEAEPAPMVFAFHGHGGNMKSAIRSFQLHELWPEAIVVYPQGLPTKGITDPKGEKSGWQKTPGDERDRDLAFFDKMLASLRQQFRIDGHRIYAMGHSNGGAFTFLLASQRHKELAAIAPSAAGSRRHFETKPIPMLYSGGTEDKLVPFAGQQRAVDTFLELNQCMKEPEEWQKTGKRYPSKINIPVATFIHPGGHTFPRELPPLIVRFFQENTKPIIKNNALHRSSPESQGVHSEQLLAFVDAVDRNIDSLHSLMVVRNGKVVAEGWWNPYDSSTRHELYSLSKSFTSTAVGIAISEGRFKLDDKVASFFPDDVPDNASPLLKAMTVRDLLTMSTGHEKEPKFTESETWVTTFMKQPVLHQPGTHFLYNTPATYMLSAIVQKTTGATTLEYLRPRLFEPIGIEGATWGTSPQGISLGGYGLSLRTEDIAKFGLLLLDRGKWNGSQLVPANWIDEATKRQVSTRRDESQDWGQGYGYQFWGCRGGYYRGDGAFGQYCLVMPEHHTVLAITAGVKDMQAVLNLVWDKLVPAIKKEALAENLEAQHQLTKRLQGLRIRSVEGRQTSETARQQGGAKFVFEPNPQKIEWVRLLPSESHTRIEISSDGKVQTLTCSPSEWTLGQVKFSIYDEQKAGMTGAWLSDNEYSAKLCMVETPFIMTLHFRFHSDSLQFEIQPNVSFGGAKPTILTGLREKQ